MGNSKYPFLSEGEENGTGSKDEPYIIHAKLSESWIQGLSRVLIGALIGSLLTIFYSQYQKNRDDLNQQFTIRKEVIHALSNFIFERRERAVLLAYGLKSGANLLDIRHRKRQYDETYVNWNKNQTVNLVNIKSIIPSTAYDPVKKAYSETIGDLFSTADSCLTDAYNIRLDGAPEALERSQKLIKDCQTFPALAVLKECGSLTIWAIDELARNNLEQQRKTILNPTSLQFWGFKAEIQSTKKANADPILKRTINTKTKSFFERFNKLEQECTLTLPSNTASKS